MKKTYILLILVVILSSVACTKNVDESKADITIGESTSEEYQLFAELVPELDEWERIVIVGCNIRNYGEYPMITDKKELEKIYHLLENDQLSLSDLDIADDPWGEFMIKTETQEVQIQFFDDSQISVDGVLYKGKRDYIKEISTVVRKIPGYGEES